LKGNDGREKQKIKKKEEEGKEEEEMSNLFYYFLNWDPRTELVKLIP